MAGLEQLPPDQRAVLALLLKQGREYDELSSVLHMSAEAVRDRAHLALETLGPDTDMSDEHLEQVCDYLLGQLPASGRSRTRDFLAASASGRAWARVVAGELRPLAANPLPEIPADDEEVDDAFDALEARRERRQEVERSSRLGGILLLAGLGIALAVVIVLLLSGGDDEEAGDTPATTQEPEVVGLIPLQPPGGGQSPLGAARLVAQNRQLSIQVAAEGLDPITEEMVYAVWLHNSAEDAQLLGFPEQQPTEEEPLLLGQKVLPANAREFEAVVITEEPRTQEAPSSPGDVVLRGALQRSSGTGRDGARPPSGEGGGGEGGSGQGGGQPRGGQPGG